jgi:hypothetical protein
MSKTERVPVKVYRWDDAGAPQVLPAEGDIKTILKACLVTGYGENENRKEPLGWEMPFENGNDACFRSTHEKSTKWALGVYGNVRYGGCNVVGLKNPKSVKTGEKAVFFQQNSVVQKFLYGSYRMDPKKQLSWVVIGHGRAFCLIILNSDFANICGNLYFGDFHSFSVADVGNCIMMGTSSYSEDLNINNSNKIVIMEGYLGNSPSEGDIKGRVMSSVNHDGVVYPNPITGGFSAENILIFEKNNQNKHMLRGKLPGFKFTFESMPSPNVLPYGKVYKNLDATDDEWMYFKTVNNLGMLVNLTAWDL